MLEKNENKQKEAGVVPFLKRADPIIVICYWPLKSVSGKKRFAELLPRVPTRIHSKQCDQIWLFLDFGQLFKAFGNK